MKGERGRSSVHVDHTGNYWFSKLSFIASWRFLLDGSHTYEFFISVDISIFDFVVTVSWTLEYCS